MKGRTSVPLPSRRRSKMEHGTRNTSQQDGIDASARYTTLLLLLLLLLLLQLLALLTR